MRGREEEEGGRPVGRKTQRDKQAKSFTAVHQRKMYLGSKMI